MASDPSSCEKTGQVMWVGPQAMWVGPAVLAWLRDYRQKVRCRAHRSTDGGACRAWAMRGQLVCHAHGGRTRQARRAGQLRLLAAAEEELATKACRKLGIPLWSTP